MLSFKNSWRIYRSPAALLLLAPACGHYGVDLGTSALEDASLSDESRAATSSRADSDGTGETRTRPTESKPLESRETKPDVSSTAGAASGSSGGQGGSSEGQTARPTQEELDAGSTGVTRDVSVTDAAAVDASVGDPDADIVPVDGGHLSPDADSSAPSSAAAQPDAGNITCDPNCECSLGVCNLTCLTQECAVTCQDGCRVEVGNAVDVTLDCKPGALCETKDIRAEVVEFVCTGGGECHTECRDGQHCSVSCEGESKCVTNCKDGAECQLACGENARCYLLYEVNEDVSLSCASGEVKYCGEDLLTCSTECP